MIRFDVVQGTPEWHACRIGIPTASCFDKIITPKTLQLSDSSSKYAHKLIAEQILGVPLDDVSSGFIARGSEQEQDARDWYELTHNCDIEQVGFVMRDDRRVGCSPDGLVGNDGLIEIKVPSAQVHVGYLLDSDGIGYKAQVQGQLWVCEREWCDTVSYNDKMPKALVRQVRDEKFIGVLARVVSQFAEYIEELKEKLIRRGLFTAEDFRKRDISGPAALKPMKHRLDPSMDKYREQRDGVISIDPFFKGPSEEEISAGLVRNEERAGRVGL